MSFQNRENDTNDTIGEYNRILEHYISILQLLNDEQSRIADIQTHVHRKVAEVLSIMRWAPNFRRVDSSLFSSLQPGSTNTNTNIPRNMNRNYSTFQNTTHLTTPPRTTRQRSQNQNQNNSPRRQTNRRSSNAISGSQRNNRGLAGLVNSGNNWNNGNNRNNGNTPPGLGNPRILNRDSSLNNLPGAMQELLNVFGNPSGENGTQVNFAIPPQNNNGQGIRNLLFEVGTFPFQSRFENVPVFPSPEQIENATESIQFQDISNPRNTNCPITMETFSQDQIVTRIRQCQHVFNTTHLNGWFRNNVQCPVCRFDIREHGQNDISGANVTQQANTDISSNINRNIIPDISMTAFIQSTTPLTPFNPLTGFGMGFGMGGGQPNYMAPSISNPITNTYTNTQTVSHNIAENLMEATLERMISGAMLNEATADTFMNVDVSGTSQGNDSDTMSQD